MSQGSIDATKRPMHEDEPATMDEARLTDASEWFVRLREATVSSEVINEWLQWCDVDPQNARAYREIQEVWLLSKDAGISEWPSNVQRRNDGYAGDIPISTWRQWQRRRPPARRGWTFVAAVAATLVVAIGAMEFVQYWNARPVPIVYATERAAKRELRLADDSVVVLGGASTMRVDYRADRRDVELESGEAHFKVMPDEARPFIVRTQDLRVTAVGTAFTIRADDGRTVVSVTDGVVDVAEWQTQSRTGHEIARARAGERITYDAQRRLAVKQPSDDAIAMGWQDGVLSYVDEPLRSVIARVNRNSTNEIVLIDPAIGELRFTGTVHERQVPEWAASLERVFPVHAITDADARILLESRPK